jgi:ribonuclease D
MQARYVTDAPGLDTLCHELGSAPWVALDTEFRRVDTYYAQLCLLQVATPALTACVDPLAVDVAPLLELLGRPQILKVLHAARQDLEVLHDLTGQVPAPVFDTQIAAALAGFADQVGYATVVEALTGERLDKSQTRTDWTRRPLSEAQLAYAADDVHHLCTVYAALEARLRALRRLDWLVEECAALADPALYRTDPADAWRRLGAGAMLAPREQALLAGLAEWRERTAQAFNRPRGWVVKDVVLVEIARRRPDSAQALAAIEGVAPALVRKRADEILEAVRSAASAPATRLYDPPVRLTPAQQQLARALAAHVAHTAESLQVPATLIATRQDLQQLLLGARDGRVLRGWRRSAVGEGLLAVLASHDATVTA